MSELLPFLIIGAIFMATNSTSGTRGVRNNNPGNIKIANNDWKGKIPVSQNTDGTFEQFESMPYGVRALRVLLTNYVNQGHNTIEKIIKKYAPSSENHTQNYINYVASRTGISSGMPVYSFNVPEILKAIIEFENGKNRVSLDDINKGLNLP